jgi:Glycosyltransferase
MIVFDNIVFTTQKSGGISVVWYELLHRILQDRKKVLFIESKNVSDNIFRKKINIHPESIILRRENRFSRHSDVKLAYNEKFIFHSSYYRVCSNRNAINITTVHDFTYEYYRSGIAKFLHNKKKIHAIKKSDFIICISENTRLDLLRFIPDIDPKKIRVIYNGVSESFFPVDLIDNPPPFDPLSFVLFVGGRNGYKNFHLAVEALKNTDFKLVIVGSKLNDKEILFLNKEIGCENYVNLVHISNEHLNALYNTAYCLLYPSLYEGFGIPVVEAQKAGCPVIAYKGSSIPEIIGETPLLFSNSNKDEIQECLKMLTNKELRDKIIQNGKENAIRFSWDKMYKDIINLYQEALTLNKS